MRCNCEENPEYFDTFPDEEVYELLTKLKQVEVSGSFNLLICELCRQFYVVELESRAPLFVKVRSREDLVRFDELKYRKLLFISAHGGISKNKCIQSNCRNNALNGMYFCVEHAFYWDNY